MKLEILSSTSRSIQLEQLSKLKKKKNRTDLALLWKRVLSGFVRGKLEVYHKAGFSTLCWYLREGEGHWVSCAGKMGKMPWVETVDGLQTLCQQCNVVIGQWSDGWREQAGRERERYGAIPRPTSEEEESVLCAHFPDLSPISWSLMLKHPLPHSVRFTSPTVLVRTTVRHHKQQCYEHTTALSAAAWKYHRGTGAAGQHGENTWR